MSIFYKLQNFQLTLSAGAEEERAGARERKFLLALKKSEKFRLI